MILPLSSRADNHEITPILLRAIGKRLLQIIRILVRATDNSRSLITAGTTAADDPSAIYRLYLKTVEVANDDGRPFAEMAVIRVCRTIAADDAFRRDEKSPRRAVLLREIPVRQNYRIIFHSLSGSTGRPMIFS